MLLGIADHGRRQLRLSGVARRRAQAVETPLRVAERIRQCLEMMPADKLAVTTDRGFSALPRHIAREKLRAMVAGARLVRKELGRS